MPRLRLDGDGGWVILEHQEARTSGLVLHFTAAVLRSMSLRRARCLVPGVNPQ